MIKFCIESHPEEESVSVDFECSGDEATLFADTMSLIRLVHGAILERDEREAGVFRKLITDTCGDPESGAWEPVDWEGEEL